MCDQKKLARVKQLIGDSTQFVSVTFIKANGQPRTVTFNKKVTAGIVGEAAAEQYQKAVQTRKEKHPNLIPVFDSQLAAQGTPTKDCWRSINTDTTIKVVADGVESKFKR
ncbi:MAG: hypothetical protein GOVbin1096_2 [Prokaryotic dsDNA virus sp.]|jgi:hypothetical protein|nr:MAG: hypothetical protein GOVbin1096_2 [Prokaryotic dsDNA virus sp.]|tara:strand:- start:36770 stop:37099 length:330 start_codon:yes stop_codon:yes gene_type:complete